MRNPKHQIGRVARARDRFLRTGSCVSAAIYTREASVRITVNGAVRGGSACDFWAVARDTDLARYRLWLRGAGVKLGQGSEMESGELGSQGRRWVVVCTSVGEVGVGRGVGAS